MVSLVHGLPLKNMANGINACSFFITIPKIFQKTGYYIKKLKYSIQRQKEKNTLK